MPGRTGTEISHAGIAAHPGRDGFQHGTDALVSLFRPARHDARSMTRAFFSSRDADAEELDTFRRQVAEAHVRIFEVGVARINDEIPWLEECEQIVDDRIHGWACGNKHHHCARLAKQADELLD